MAINTAGDIAFTSSWEIRVSTGILPGTDVSILYDRRRLPNIASGGTKITAHIKFNLSNNTAFFQDYDLLSFKGDVSKPPPFICECVVPLPKKVASLDVWFSNNTSGMDTAWDSNFGSNHSISIEQSYKPAFSPKEETKKPEEKVDKKEEQPPQPREDPEQNWIEVKDPAEEYKVPVGYEEKETVEEEEEEQDMEAHHFNTSRFWDQADHSNLYHVDDLADFIA
mmetsp:Transcript_22900/g.25475  ORF Transcript_22900/g.25475 Transcript_22900/m.25475 type:complete len:224 (+) Transcript_22900:39-710(+)